MIEGAISPEDRDERVRSVMLLQVYVLTGPPAAILGRRRWREALPLWFLAAGFGMALALGSRRPTDSM
jgi:hypothetical protein